ncbi:uncharacterized protein LOC114363978 [Ostrinia furnacalis]|uniref:uncharacterized protein LOC114363978 n=1 Tax=Ostrinia furnacalis TaxID=93504 RepID=UPI00103DE49B|nr:uncharacterized protein LOC114363978 [Ostrinia furnacalis]
MATLISLLAVTAVLATPSAALESSSDPQSDTCAKLSSCATCLSKSYCSWCVTKSKCTKQSCGNDNVIYPKSVKALMSGPQFCPRIVRPEKELAFESGKKQILSVKITQIYLYMAFTTWKCRISLNDEEIDVNAVLLADEVYCDSVVLSNKSDKPEAAGSVTLLWEQNKVLDGSVPFIVCRCDMDSGCAVCK